VRGLGRLRGRPGARPHGRPGRAAGPQGCGKKLRGAARHWLLNARWAQHDAEHEDAQLRAQWQQLGADPAQARQAANDDARAPEPDHYELPPELWPAWECFVATWSQWRIVAGLGGVYCEGIDHASLVATMELLGVKKNKRREVFLHLRILESEAKPLRNERE